MDTGQTTFRAGTWNTQWAKPGSARGRRVGVALAGPGCDVMCVTEGYADILPADGYVMDAGPDWGYGIQAERRKALVWSKQPWCEIDPVGLDTLPGGRFVAGVTRTPLGSLTVVGVCIPWRGANVRSGRKDRDPWQDLEAWLAGFERLRDRYVRERTVIMGDFNQQVPRTRMAVRRYEALRRAFEGFAFATEGDLPGSTGRAIDHIAHTPDLSPAGEIGLWPRRSEQDGPLSDHFGVWADFAVSS